MTLYLDGKLHDTTPGIPFSRVPCRLESNLTPSTSAQEGRRCIWRDVTPAPCCDGRPHFIDRG